MRAWPHIAFSHALPRLFKLKLPTERWWGHWWDPALRRGTGGVVIPRPCFLFLDEPVPAGPAQANDEALTRQLRRIIAAVKTRMKFPDVFLPDEHAGEAA